MYATEVLTEHVTESNGIEGIHADPESPYFRQHLLALKKALKHAASAEPLTLEDICKWHRTMLKGILPQAGKLRCDIGAKGVEVRVGEYACPHSSKIKDMLKLWLSHVNGCQHTGSACFRHHYAFETIHPFIDGNGRIGRILFLWEQARAGCDTPHIFREDSRMEYYDHITYWREEEGASFFGNFV